MGIDVNGPRLPLTVHLPAELIEEIRTLAKEKTLSVDDVVMEACLGYTEPHFWERGYKETAMNNPISSPVAVYLPADLVAKMEQLKQDREEDQNKSIQQLVEAFCRRYVKLQEGHRWEREHREELERAYSDSSGGGDDPNEWADVYAEEEEEPS